MEQINKMFYHFAQDSEFAAQMQALIKTLDVTAIIAAGAEKGFVFTEADWQAFIDWNAEHRELSPEKLESVAGGVFWDEPKHFCRFWSGKEPDKEIDGVMHKKCSQIFCYGYDYDIGGDYWMCACAISGACKNKWHKISTCDRV